MKQKTDEERIALTIKGLKAVADFAAKNGNQRAVQLINELLLAHETGGDHPLLALWRQRRAEREAAKKE